MTLKPNESSDGADNKGRPRVHQSVTIALLVCSVFLNVILARKVEQLKNNLQVIKSEGKLPTGASVPAITARDLDGNPATISYGGDATPTVLYVFSPECGWCTRNLQNVRTLADGVRGRYRFIGVSLSKKMLREYVAEHEFDFPIYTDLPADVKASYKLGGTPQTIIISADGQVVKNWMGAYTGDLEDEVEEFFSLHLPGLRL